MNKNRTIEEFVNRICCINKSKWGKQVKVRLQPILKNNGIRLLGLCFEEHENIGTCPVIYVERIYEEFIAGKKNMDEAAEEILRLYEDSKGNCTFRVVTFTNYEVAKENIVYKLINYEMNKELLLDVPYKRFLDFAIVCMYLVDEQAMNLNGGYATILIRNMHLDIWNISDKELFERAEVNTPRIFPYSIRSFEDILADMGIICREEMEEECIQMYMITNRMKFYGAAAILYEGVLQKVAEQQNSNLFVLPSSTHEILVIPDFNGEKNVEQFSQMVKEVNRDAVCREDILGERAYYYSREERNFVILEEKQVE